MSPRCPGGRRAGETQGHGSAGDRTETPGPRWEETPLASRWAPGTVEREETQCVWVRPHSGHTGLGQGVGESPREPGTQQWARWREARGLGARGSFGGAWEGREGGRAGSCMPFGKERSPGGTGHPERRAAPPSSRGAAGPPQGGQAGLPLPLRQEQAGGRDFPGGHRHGAETGPQAAPGRPDAEPKLHATFWAEWWMLGGGNPRGLPGGGPASAPRAPGCVPGPPASGISRQLLLSGRRGTIRQANWTSTRPQTQVRLRFITARAEGAPLSGGRWISA